MPLLYPPVDYKNRTAGSAGWNFLCLVIITRYNMEEIKEDKKNRRSNAAAVRLKLNFL